MRYYAVLEGILTCDFFQKRITNIKIAMIKIQIPKKHEEQTKSHTQ